jgi:hypothetical protein
LPPPVSSVQHDLGDVGRAGRGDAVENGEAGVAPLSDLERRAILAYLERNAGKD